MDTTFYVTKIPGPAILGLPPYSRLRIVQLNCSVQFRKHGKPAKPCPEREKVQQDMKKFWPINSRKDLIKAYPDHIEGIGKFPAAACTQQKTPAHADVKQTCNDVAPHQSACTIKAPQHLIEQMYIQLWWCHRMSKCSCAQWITIRRHSKTQLLKHIFQIHESYTQPFTLYSSLKVNDMHIKFYIWIRLRRGMLYCSVHASLPFGTFSKAWLCMEFFVQ